MFKRIPLQRTKALDPFCFVLLSADVCRIWVEVVHVNKSYICPSGLSIFEELGGYSEVEF